MAGVMGLEDNPPLPRLWNAPKHDIEATEFIPHGGPVLAVGPTANWRAKIWRSEKFAELCQRVMIPGGLFENGRIAIFGSQEERPQAIKLLESIPKRQCIDLIGQVSLLGAHACLKRCICFVGNDSGLMHIAAASGIPTLGLFGPSREELYGPSGNFTATVRTPENFLNIHPDNFNHKTTDSLMDGLSVDQVVEALSALIAKAQGPKLEPIH